MQKRPETGALFLLLCCNRCFLVGVFCVKQVEHYEDIYCIVEVERNVVVGLRYISNKDIDQREYFTPKP